MHQSVSSKRKAPLLSLGQDCPGLRLSLSAIWWPVSILQTPLREALWLGLHEVEGKKGASFPENLVPGEGKLVKGGA